MYYDYIWSSLKIELSDDVLLQCTKWTFVLFYCSQHGKVFRCPKCNEEVGDGSNQVKQCSCMYELFVTTVFTQIHTVAFLLEI